MTKLFKVLAVFFLAVMLSGCVTERLPAEDVEVLDVCSREISVLQSKKYTPNSREKYEAAKSLLKKVDFSYIRRVETLDAIFSSLDAQVDKPDSRTQMLNFYYQYKGHSIRFVFNRYDNIVTRFEVIEK